MPLADIRNKLVHGYTFNNEEWNLMTIAHQHLQWRLERMLLRILGWDVNRSRVSSDFLDSNYKSIYINWVNDRDRLINIEHNA